MTDLNEVRAYLCSVVSREPSDEKIYARLDELKAQAVAVDDQVLAKAVWCYETILRIQSLFVSAFNLLKAEQFYDAWCEFERVEHGINALGRHFPLDDDTYKLLSIDRHTKQFQSLFPYKMFGSPEYLALEKKCTICDQVVSIRNSCGHIQGEIYNGEMCSRVITELEFIGMGIVEKPAQKYSVLFPSDADGKRIDSHDYTFLKVIAKGLSSPFDGWEIEWTKRRHPHSKFQYLSRNDKCPCESGKKYKKCCLNEEGILRPHLNITFEVEPEEKLPPLFYTY